MTKRFYMQCCLTVDDLFERGACDFHSCLTQSFYRLLLRQPELAGIGFTGVECLRHLNELEGKPFEQFDKLNDLAPEPTHPVAVDDIECVGSDGEEPVGEPELEAGGGGVEPDHDDSRSGASSGDESGGFVEIDFIPPIVDAAPVVAVHDVFIPDIPDHPPFILGQKVLLKVHAVHNSIGLQVNCPNPIHLNCFKYRSTRLDGAYGVRGTEAYLGGWLMQADAMTEANHKKHKTTKPQIDEYLALYA